MYQSSNITFVHNATEMQKNYDIYAWEDLFLSEDVLQGPIKMEHANTMMYVVKNLDKSDYTLEEEATAEEKKEISFEMT